jgi:O-antigen/teichoic acid export membrane protein
LSRFVESVFVINILPNIVVFLFFLPGFLDWISVSLEYSLLVIFFSYVISFLAGLFFLRDVFCRRFPEIRKAYDSGFLNGFGSMYAVDLMAVNILWASQILAGFWLRADELAHLASAQRTAAIAGLLLIAINTVTAPRYAAMYHEGRHADLKHLAQSSTMVVLFIALPLVGLMCAFPSPIMSLFGDDFRDASVLLVVLAIGQLANAATGSVGYLLIMSGHQRDLRNVAFVSGMSAIIFPLILLPVMGVIGAAVSSSLAVATQNLLAMYMVRRRLGFWTFSFAAATLLFSKTVKLAPKLTRE